MPAAVIGSLERLVRPFQKETAGRRTPRARPAQDEEAAVLEWTASTRVNSTVVPGVAWSIVPVEDEEHEEELRDVVEERIENPDDPEQYVIVEKVQEISFRDPTTGILRKYILKETSRSPA